MIIRHWIKAFRLRTLPLALSSTAMGSFLAFQQQSFSLKVFALSVLTTLLLQILSNLANDLGDTQHGVDNENRLGPARTTQSGAITQGQMKRMIWAIGVLAFLSGLLLLYVGLHGVVFSGIFFGMLLLGMLAILAALKYTMGNKPYGYAGFGDVFVFLFFGLTGVLGTCFLHTHSIHLLDFLPAITLGLFSTAVLNLNNLRDVENDQENGKNTLVVRLGENLGRWYHLVLMLCGCLSAIGYMLSIKPVHYLLWLFIPYVFFWHITWGVFTVKTPAYFNKSLRNLSLTIFVFTILFGVGLIS